jgi:hypothetical protein
MIGRPIAGTMSVAVVVVASIGWQARPSPGSFSARWERGGVLSVQEGSRTVHINLSDDIVGCLSQLYDGATRERFGSGEKPGRILDVTEAKGHRFILAAAIAAPNCNVQGHCGAGDDNVTLIWVKLATDLSVIAKNAFAVADCRRNRWVEGERPGTREMGDLPGQVSYTREAASAGMTITRLEQQ